NVQDEVVVFQINDNDPKAGGGSCFGDSGGAVFLNGYVLGDASYVNSLTCNATGGYQRDDTPHSRAFLRHFPNPQPYHPGAPAEAHHAPARPRRGELPDGSRSARRCRCVGRSPGYAKDHEVTLAVLAVNSRRPPAAGPPPRGVMSSRASV